MFTYHFYYVLPLQYMKMRTSQCVQLFSVYHLYFMLTPWKHEKLVVYHLYIPTFPNYNDSKCFSRCPTHYDYNNGVTDTY